MLVYFIVVAYNSERERLDRVLNAAAREARVIVVDNSTSSDARRIVADATARVGAGYRSMDGNAGIARAINTGARDAFGNGADAVVLLDDDSIVPVGFIQRMCETFVLSPRRIVSATGGETAKLQRPSVATTDTMMSSGSLISREAFEEIGGMNEPLFVDLVDFEWAWRAEDLGWQVVCDTGVILEHRRGEGGYTFLGVELHYSAPTREYYAIRNLVHLIHQGSLSRGRAARLFAKNVLRIALLAALGPNRIQRLRFFTTGLRDGMRGRLGSINANQ
jgi:rhamnosyltransferase